jgi:hypothetical protein
MRQASCQQADPAALVQESPKGGASSVRTQLLVGELDLDGLASALELNRRGHRLVHRADARRWRGFHLPPISS